MISVPVRHDVRGFIDQGKGTDAISLFAVQMDVLHIVVHQTRAVPSRPADILHDIDPLCQLVKANRAAKERVIGQDRLGVCDTVPCLAFLGRFQKLPHVLDCHVRLACR